MIVIKGRHLLRVYHVISKWDGKVCIDTVDWFSNRNGTTVHGAGSQGEFEWFYGPHERETAQAALRSLLGPGDWLSK